MGDNMYEFVEKIAKHTNELNRQLESMWRELIELVQSHKIFQVGDAICATLEPLRPVVETTSPVRVKVKFPTLVYEGGDRSRQIWEWQSQEIKLLYITIRDENCTVGLRMNDDSLHTLKCLRRVGQDYVNEYIIDKRFYLKDGLTKTIQFILFWKYNYEAIFSAIRVELGKRYEETKAILEESFRKIEKIRARKKTRVEALASEVKTESG